MNHAGDLLQHIISSVLVEGSDTGRYRNCDKGDELANVHSYFETAIVALS